MSEKEIKEPLETVVEEKEIKKVEEVLNETEIENLKSRLEGKLEGINKKDQWKIRNIIDSIPEKCRLDQLSKDHAKMKKEDEKKFHPVRPKRGEIYNVLLSGDNVGTELINNHLCIVISNQRKNIYSEKVNVVPIEGDGRKIDKMNNIQLVNADLTEGSLDKDPSKIIGGDIMTIDKSRIGLRIGKLKKEKMTEVMKMVKAQLDL